MAKAKDCERCGKRFLAEPNEPVLCILCLADYQHEQREDSDNGDSGNVPIGDVGS